MRRGIAIINKITSSKFIRSAVTLSSGTAISQIIAISTIPVISRIYLPEYYGVLGLFVMISTVLSTVSTFQYQNAVITARDDEEARNAISLCIVIAFLVSFVCFFVFLIFQSQIISLLGVKELGSWILLTPVSILFNGVNAGAASWVNRRANYNLLRTTRIITAILTPLISIPLGIFISGPFGLIVAFLVSSIFPTLMILHYLRNKNDLKLRFDRNLLIDCGKKYIDLPLFSLPATFLNNVINYVPVLMFGRLYGEKLVGHYNMSYRVLGLPVMLISTSFAEVFRQRAAKEFNEKGECKIFFHKTFFSLATISIIPFLSLFLFGPQIFELVLGKNWRHAGVMSSILAPMFFLRFTIAPLSYMYFIAGKQKENFALQLILLVLILIPFLLSQYFRWDDKSTLFGYAVAYSTIYLFYLFRSYQFSKGKTLAPA